jgi:hypothetical protein
MSFFENPLYDQSRLPPTFASLTAIAVSGWSPLDQFDVRPFLCDLIKNSTNPDADVLIRQESESGFDYEHHLDGYYAQLSAMRGDGRVDFKYVWDAVSLEFLPRAQTQIELAQAGGCQIIDRYICDENGVKIREASSTCVEGDEALKPITSQEIILFVNNIILNERQSHAQGFVNYLNTNFKTQGWTLKSYFYSRTYFYYVEAVRNLTPPSQGVEKRYFKYFYDQRDFIASALNIPLIVNNSLIFDIDPAPANLNAFVDALSIPEIPDYRNL